MKEIDFLPSWYKSDRRRQMSYRTQCVALACVFVAMMVWNFVCAHSVSKARGELTQNIVRQAEAISASREFARVEHEVAQLQKKADFIDRIDSKIDVGSVLAEMSFLIENNVILSKVELLAERLFSRRRAQGGGGSAVKIAGGPGITKKELPLGHARFKVVIGGVASKASDVAELICRLEDSPYFFHVIPSFSRNKNIKAAAGAAKEDFQLSEFEIVCYLANYRQEALSVPKETQEMGIEVAKKAAQRQ